MLNKIIGAGVALVLVLPAVVEIFARRAGVPPSTRMELAIEVTLAALGVFGVFSILVVGG